MRQKLKYKLNLFTLNFINNVSLNDAIHFETQAKRRQYFGFAHRYPTTVSNTTKAWQHFFYLIRIGKI